MFICVNSDTLTCIQMGKAQMRDQVTRLRLHHFDFIVWNRWKLKGEKKREKEKTEHNKNNNWMFRTWEEQSFQESRVWKYNIDNDDSLKL